MVKERRKTRKNNHISSLGKVLMLIHVLFSLCNALSNTFVNVYLFRLTSDLKYLGIYNIIVYFFVPVAFILSGYIARKKGTTYCFRLGIVFYIIFYLSVLILKEKVKEFLPLVGVFSGLAMGFYYYGYNKLVFDVTDDKNRGYYLGISGSIISITAALAPMLSGFVIVNFIGMLGYYIIFGISFVLFVLAIILSSKLKNEKLSGTFNFKETLLNSGYKPWDKIMRANFLMGLKDGAMAYLLNILVYLIFGNELAMGKYTTIVSILGIISSYIVGKMYKRDKASKWLFSAAISIFISTILLVILNNRTGIVINGIVSSIFTIFWNVPFNEIMYHVAHKASEKKDNLGDLLIVREIPIAAGRILGFILYISVSLLFVGDTPIKIILPLLASIGVINFIYLRTVIKEK
ncbi:MFS transporter [Clostridium sp. YIM B02551]|uniref:MFS transporter n=1 Tax=Clostridium sp. YIM B02551 TaxID=2910679 RepID=UPI001EEC2207|nr:MFS transporter [Clostridium sp. YIM B02551]